MLKDIIGKASSQISEFWDRKDKKEKKNLIILVVAILALIVLSSLFLTHKTYEPLYTNLETKDAGDIMKKLQEMNVDAKVTDNTISVPGEEVDRLRMDLASEGFPKNGFDLSIIDKGSGFGSTEKDKQVYRQYQLQLNLEKAIKTMNNIENATVNLTIPEESYMVTTNDNISATAAILVKINDNTQLSSENVKAIAVMVQKSVPGLSLENISVIDSNMNVLSVDSDTNFSDIGDKFEYQNVIQDRLRKQVLSLLQPVFGIGNVMSEVSVELDFSEHAVQTTTYEPVIDGKTGIAVSIDRIREETKANGGTGAAGTDTNGAANTYPINNTENEIYYKNSEKINYEVNTIKDELVEEKGRIKKMNVSVLLDGNQAGNQNYVEGIKDLVSATVGVDPKNVVVGTLPFNGTKAIKDAMEKAAANNVDKLNQLDYYKIMMYGFGFVLLLVLIFVGLSMRKKGKKVKRKKNKAGIDELVQGDYTELELVAATREERNDPRINDNRSIDTRSIDPRSSDPYESKPRARTPSDDKREDIENLITSDPEMVIKLLRNWMIFD